MLFIQDNAQKVSDLHQLYIWLNKSKYRQHLIILKSEIHYCDCSEVTTYKNYGAYGLSDYFIYPGQRLKVFSLVLWWFYIIRYELRRQCLITYQAIGVSVHGMYSIVVLKSVKVLHVLGEC